MADEATPPQRGDMDGYAAPADVPVTAASGANVVRAGRQPAVSPAEWTYERLVRQIETFEGKLSDKEEIGGRLTAGPGDATFRIEDLGWWGPDIIIFYGRNEHGRPVQLIQHYTQLNVLLTATPKATPEPPRRIGFHLRRALEEEPAA